MTTPPIPFFAVSELCFFFSVFRGILKHCSRTLSIVYHYAQSASLTTGTAPLNHFNWGGDICKTIFFYFTVPACSAATHHRPPGGPETHDPVLVYRTEAGPRHRMASQSAYLPPAASRRWRLTGTQLADASSGTCESQRTPGLVHLMLVTKDLTPDLLAPDESPAVCWRMGLPHPKAAATGNFTSNLMTIFTAIAAKVCALWWLSLIIS